MITPNISIQKRLTDEQKEQILEIWNEEYPSHLQHKNLKNFNQYLKEFLEAHHYLVIDESNVIKGWLATFDRKNERWLVLMIHSSFQSKGIGSALLNRAKKDESLLNAWVIDHNNDRKTDGSPYKSPLLFYTKNHFSTLTDVRLEDGHLSAVKIQWKASDEI